MIPELHQVHIEAISKEKALNVLKKIQQIPEDMRPDSWRIAQKPESATASGRYVGSSGDMAGRFGPPLHNVLTAP